MRGDAGGSHLVEFRGFLLRDDAFVDDVSAKDDGSPFRVGALVELDQKVA